MAIIHSPVPPEAEHRALQAALAAGVTGGPAACARRSPMRWSHARTHYYDETLKAPEGPRTYGEPLAHRDGARIFMRQLRDGLRPAAFAVTVERLRCRPSVPSAAPDHLQPGGRSDAPPRDRYRPSPCPRPVACLIGLEAAEVSTRAPHARLPGRIEAATGGREAAADGQQGGRPRW
ncbi:hypothetical protein [Actinomadura macrotermitis]|uniref:hypothetical protein n=1 Tax=Actinomadura macrotermitis TaxID=2585200 RepID=UPI0012957B7F|nr:hypothetical protein [Actinomadura macrotermitis]